MICLGLFGQLVAAGVIVMGECGSTFILGSAVY